jgi:activator of Hsp90 ATPase-like protein
MTPPLRLSFDVACSVEHAFAVWTSDIGTWWPRDHTVSGQPEQVVLQGEVGGRIYERTREGVEHDWGEVTAWDPPGSLSYLWHLGRGRDAATEVEIQFVAQGDGMTRIAIEHRGWDRLGAEAAEWRDRNQFGWDSLIPHFRAAVTRGDS